MRRNMAQPSSSSPSLPRVRDVVKGHYKILRNKGVEYKAEFKHYQVEKITTVTTDSAGLSSASVELILLQGPQGDKVEGSLMRTKTFQLDEKWKAREIRDALEKGGQDVYCTVSRGWGFEVLGDIKSLPKDPPILKLPEEMMDMICTYLDDKDLYSLRLVSPLIPQRFLPIQKLWRIEELELDVTENEIKSTVFITRKKKNGESRWRNDFNLGSRLEFLNEAYADFLRAANELHVYKSTRSRSDEVRVLKPTVERTCTKGRLTISFSDVVDHNLIYHLTSWNQRTLKKLKVRGFEDTDVDEDDDEDKDGCKDNDVGNFYFDLASISGCKGLKEISVECGQLVNLKSLASLKGTLKKVDFTLEKPLTKDELVCVSRILPKLEQLGVNVLHRCDCYAPQEGEVDGDAVLTVLKRIHKSIDFRLSIYLHNCTDGDERCGRDSKSGFLKFYCGKANRIKKQVMRALKDKGKISEWSYDLSSFMHDRVNVSELAFRRRRGW